MILWANLRNFHVKEDAPWVYPFQQGDHVYYTDGSIVVRTPLSFMADFEPDYKNKKPNPDMSQLPWEAFKTAAFEPWPWKNLFPFHPKRTEVKCDFCHGHGVHTLLVGTPEYIGQACGKCNRKGKRLVDELLTTVMKNVPYNRAYLYRMTGLKTTDWAQADLCPAEPKPKNMGLLFRFMDQGEGILMPCLSKAEREEEEIF